MMERISYFVVHTKAFGFQQNCLWKMSCRAPSSVNINRTHNRYVLGVYMRNTVMPSKKNQLVCATQPWKTSGVNFL